MPTRLPAALLWAAALCAASAHPAPAGAPGGSGPWFPSSGPAALHQRLLDIDRPAVVLMVSQQPGEEDLSLLAWLRFHAGAAVTVVHVTNAETLPGDTLADQPLQLAALRKEEAFAAASAAGADAWFLNLPDPGAAESAAALALRWPSDTLVARLSAAIRTIRPDLVVLAREPGGAMTPRDSVLREAALRAVDRAASSRDTGGTVAPWTARRIALEIPAPALPADFSAAHPIWKTTPLEMARRLGALYRSLRLTAPGREAGGKAWRLLGTREPRALAPSALLAGLPRIPSRLKGVLDAVHRAASPIRRGVRSGSLAAVAVAIDSTERALAAYGLGLSPLERRVVALWKNGLEDARCMLLGVKIEVAQSESLVTSSQVWFLRVGKIAPAPAPGTLEIIFPLAIERGWVVNESLSYRFPLAAPEQFNILTPEEMTYNYPVSLFGMEASSLRIRFPYLIVHKDVRRERSFVHRGEALLMVGPRRSFEVRTPVVIAAPGEPVVTAMLNFSRDRFEGTVTLSDTSKLMVSQPVALKHKDHLLLDTLLLPYTTPPSPGNYPWVVELSGKGGRRNVTARRPAVRADSAVRALLFTEVHGSPVADALRAIGQPWTTLGAAGSGGGSFAGDAGVLIIDRESLSGIPSGEGSALRAWIRNGGRMVVFPQSGEGTGLLRDLCGAAFRPLRPLLPGASVSLDRGSRVLASPNVLGQGAWDGWVVSRARFGIELPAAAAGEDVTVSAEGVPLLAGVAVGKGRVTLVALDLLSQFTNFHEGAFRLLANILASP